MDSEGVGLGLDELSLLVPSWGLLPLVRTGKDW